MLTILKILKNENDFYFNKCFTNLTKLNKFKKMFEKTISENDFFKFHKKI